MATEFNLESFMPSGEHEYLRPAWASCLQWCIGEPDMLAQFREQTGCKYTAPRNPLDAVIDKATGNDQRFVEELVTWFNEWIWGPVP